MKCYVLSFLLLCTYIPVWASNDVMNVTTQNTISQNVTTVSSIVDTVRHWNLTETEWARYLELMQGQAGYYYAHLTPPEVLGHYAEDVQDIRHFAEIHAKLEHDRIERELRFDKAFNEAAVRLYENELIIKPFDITAYTPIPKVDNEK